MIGHALRARARFEEYNAPKYGRVLRGVIPVQIATRCLAEQSRFILRLINQGLVLYDLCPLLEWKVSQALSFEVLENQPYSVFSSLEPIFDTISKTGFRLDFLL